MEDVVRVNEKGRLLIPKEIRKPISLAPGSPAHVKAGRMVVESLDSVAERFYGVFRAERVPENLDEYLEKAVAECLARDTST